MITAISSVWGMLNETTVKDSDGKKRLTKAGYVAVTMIVGSAILGVASHAIENTLKVDKNIPLKFLDFEIELFKLPSTAIKEIQDGKKRINDFWDSDDELKFLESASRNDLQSALERVFILFPLMKSIIGNRQASSVMFLIDIDGTGTVLLPIGVVKGEASLGYLDNTTALNLQLNIHDDSEDANQQFEKSNPLPYECGRYSILIDENKRSLLIKGKALAQCLNKVIHRPEDMQVSVAIVKKPRLLIIAEGEFLPINPINASINKIPTGLCWSNNFNQKDSNLNAHINLVLNGDQKLALSNTVAARDPIKLVHGGGAEMEPLDYGLCMAFN